MEGGSGGGGAAAAGGGPCCCLTRSLQAAADQWIALRRSSYALGVVGALVDAAVTGVATEQWIAAKDVWRQRLGGGGRRVAAATAAVAPESVLAETLPPSACVAGFPGLCTARKR